MKNQKNTRSLFALAAENSLNSDYNKKIQTKPSNERNNLSLDLANYQGKQKKLSQPSNFLPQSKNHPDPLAQRTKQIIKNLGLSRLRKIQALVRGFLCRRIIVPKAYTSYLIAKSISQIMIQNIVYGEASAVLVESVTLGKYDGQGIKSQKRYLEDYFYDMIVKNVIKQVVEPISRQAVYEVVKYSSRPTITFGFNLRDPLELLLYLLVCRIVNEHSKQVAQQCLVDQAQNRRQLMVIDSWVNQMGVVKNLCQQVIQQCLFEGVSEFVSETVLQRITKEGAQVVAVLVYNKQLQKIEQKFISSLSEQGQQWFLQEVVNQLLVEYNFGRKDQNENK